MAGPNFPAVQVQSFPLVGGLDLHSPQSAQQPGVARSMQNFECGINGGYSRIPGYERFDGRPSPTAAVVGTLQMGAVPAVAVGATITGATSGATGVVAAVDGATLVYTKATGTFVDGETINAGATPVGAALQVGVQVLDPQKRGEHALACYMLYRADIQAVPGSGPVRGIFLYQGYVYAWRDSAGATACLLYRADTSGWTAIAMPRELRFTAGSGPVPLEGSVISRAGVSATVRRVALESGSWQAGTAAGRFIITAPVGGEFSAGSTTITGGTVTLSGASTAVSFLPGGRFEHDVGNAGNGVRVYGCDGVNRGFEFDGTYVCPIVTGNLVDAPSHVRIHKLHLFFSFIASAQHSGIGAPFTWTVLAGAGELKVDSPISGFLVLPGSENTAAMAILSNDSVSILYGTSAAAWNLANMNPGYGSKAYAQQALGRALIYDDLGIVTLDAVQAYGNFSTTALTVRLRAFVQQRRTLVTDSLVNKEKSQYRVFFSDGYGLYMTLVNGKYIGAAPVVFNRPVLVACSGASTNGGEVSYFGSSDGFVYRMDTGTSFDGAPIDASFELAFGGQGNNRMIKRYRRAVFEVQGEGSAEFKVGYQLGYGETDVSLDGMLKTSTSPSYWDSFAWDTFVWDGRSIAPSQARLQGSAENISMRIETSSPYWQPFTINSITLHFNPRRLLRR